MNTPDKEKEENIQKLEKRIIHEIASISWTTVVRVVDSLASDKLMESVKKVCSEKDTPISFLIYFHAHLLYNKTFPDRNYIKKKMNTRDYSELSKKLARYFFRHHVEYHNISDKDIRKYGQLLGIEPNKLYAKRIMKDLKIKDREPRKTREKNNL